MTAPAVVPGQQAGVSLGVKRPISVKIFAHSLGAVSYEIIRRAKCPVLTVSA
jgi:hypothetical protein